MIQPYGRLDIKTTLQKNLLRALIISVAIHCMVIGAYYLHQFFSDEDELPMVSVRLMKYSELGPPPSMTNVEQLPSVGVTVAHAKLSIGIPVPVPDVEVNPEQTIASQQELSQIQSPMIADGSTPERVVVEQDIAIDDEPLPNEFVPVEKEPIPVKQVKPEYPEIARRTGIEGVVWVKILVDKQGKARKAIVMKSDSEIFDAAAIQAALQWVFTPAIMNAGPISVWVAIPFRFQLNKQS